MFEWLFAQALIAIRSAPRSYLAAMLTHVRWLFAQALIAIRSAPRSYLAAMLTHVPNGVIPAASVRAGRSGRARAGPCDHERVSLPSYPVPSGRQSGSSQPGLYPLRPLAVGELLTAATRVTWRHANILVPIAFAVAVLNTGVSLAVLAVTGYLRLFASGTYLNQVKNPTPAELSALLGRLGHIYLGLGAGTVISLICAPVLAGLTAPLAAVAATSRTGTATAALARLKGRWAGLFLIGVVVGLAVAVGLVALLVPGIMIWLILLPAGPVAAMEGSPSVGATLRRAAALSKGFKARILGITVLATVFVVLIGLVEGAIAGRLVSAGDDVTRLLLTQGLSVVVAAFTGAWLAGVTAMLYIDIRLRREHLAQALLASTR